MSQRPKLPPSAVPAGPGPANLLALDKQFCFALYSASHAVTKTYKPLLDQLGLTYPQYLVMLVLWEQDAILVKDIGARLFLDSGTLTPLLKRLESNGLVERNRDPHDERQVRISLSPAGRDLRQKALDIPEQMLCTTGKDAPALGELRKGLSSVRDNMFDLLDENKAE
ncbi:MAG: MarR family winged helix-turn-helix transcriptional regulator [Massilia sp.]